VRRLLCLTTCLLWALLLSPPSSGAASSDVAAEEEAYLRLVLPEDELVETATRNPKLLTQVAENLTVVTADEIEAMNAHTLAEVLNRVTGVFVQFFGVHFGANALPHIQGSGASDFTGDRGADEKHVQAFVDGIPWSSLFGDSRLSTIPIGSIDRIEVIAGPASSTWGSALGGVINVITKKTGQAARPTGSASGSAGERDAYDGRVEAAGAVGGVGYYLFGQGQHAEWDDAGGGFESRSLFAKTQTRLAREICHSHLICLAAMVALTALQLLSVP